VLDLSIGGRSSDELIPVTLMGSSELSGSSLVLVWKLVNKLFVVQHVVIGWDVRGLMLVIPRSEEDSVSKLINGLTVLSLVALFEGC